VLFIKFNENKKINALYISIINPATLLEKDSLLINLIFIFS